MACLKHGFDEKTDFHFFYFVCLWFEEWGSRRQQYKKRQIKSRTWPIVGTY